MTNPYESWWKPRRLTLEQYKEVMKQKELKKQVLSSTQLAKKFGVKKSDIANAWYQGYARYDKLLKEKEDAE
jgi:ribosome-binding protein aMBF1 (putative translation factor)